MAESPEEHAQNLAAILWSVYDTIRSLMAAFPVPITIPTVEEAVLETEDGTPDLFEMLGHIFAEVLRDTVGVREEVKVLTGASILRWMMAADQVSLYALDPPLAWRGLVAEYAVKDALDAVEMAGMLFFDN